MEHLRHRCLIRHPLGQFTGGSILGVVSQSDAGQATQNRLCVIGSHPQAQPHMGQQQATVQGFVTRDDRTHQDISPPARVLREGLHGHVHARLKRRKSNASTPGVVQCGHDALGAIAMAESVVGLLNHRHQGRQVRILQRHRAGHLQPDQPRRLTELGRQIGGIHGVVKTVSNAPGSQLPFGQRFAGSIGVIGQQHLVTRAQQGHVHQRNGGQAARRQERKAPAFERGDALFQRE